MEMMSRRERLLAMRKQPQTNLESSRRNEILQNLEEQCRRTEDITRKEMNPWMFKKNEKLNKKWERVNDAVVMQELLVVVRDAKRRRDQDLAVTTNRRCHVEHGTDNHDEGTSHCSVSFCEVNFQPNREGQPHREGQSHREGQPHREGQHSSEDDSSRVQHEVKGQNVNLLVPAPKPDILYVGSGKTTVYSSGRRTYPKRSNNNNDLTPEAEAQDHVDRPVIRAGNEKTNLNTRQDTENKNIHPEKIADKKDVHILYVDKATASISVPNPATNEDPHPRENVSTNIKPMLRSSPLNKPDRSRRLNRLQTLGSVKLHQIKVNTQDQSSVFNTKNCDNNRSHTVTLSNRHSQLRPSPFIAQRIADITTIYG